MYAIFSIVSLKMQTPAIINNMQTSVPDQGLLSQNQQNICICIYLLTKKFKQILQNFSTGLSICLDLNSKLKTYCLLALEHVFLN